MLKKINQLLKLVGFNLVHAKKVKSKTLRPPYGVGKHENAYQTEANKIEDAGYRCHVPIEDAKTDAHCTPPPGFIYPDEYNPNNHTTKSGDPCAHICGTENIALGHATLGYPAQVKVVDPDAAFEPVDIGVGKDERPRVKQPVSDNKVTGASS